MIPLQEVLASCHDRPILIAGDVEAKNYVLRYIQRFLRLQDCQPVETTVLSLSKNQSSYNDRDATDKVPQRDDLTRRRSRTSERSSSNDSKDSFSSSESEVTVIQEALARVRASGNRTMVIVQVDQVLADLLSSSSSSSANINSQARRARRSKQKTQKQTQHPIWRMMQDTPSMNASGVMLVFVTSPFHWLAYVEDGTEHATDFMAEEDLTESQEEMWKRDEVTGSNALRLVELRGRDPYRSRVVWNVFVETRKNPRRRIAKDTAVRPVFPVSPVPITQKMGIFRKLRHDPIPVKILCKMLTTIKLDWDRTLTPRTLFTEICDTISKKLLSFQLADWSEHAVALSNQDFLGSICKCLCSKESSVSERAAASQLLHLLLSRPNNTSSAVKTRRELVWSLAEFKESGINRGGGREWVSLVVCKNLTAANKVLRWALCEIPVSSHAAMILDECVDLYQGASCVLGNYCDRFTQPPPVGMPCAFKDTTRCVQWMKDVADAIMETIPVQLRLLVAVSEEASVRRVSKSLATLIRALQVLLQRVPKRENGVWICGAQARIKELLWEVSETPECIQVARDCAISYLAVLERMALLKSH